MSATRLVFGCGYLGARAAAIWHNAGDTVYAVTRDSRRASEFRNRGWEPIVADVLDSSSLLELPAAETVLFAIARGRGSQTPIRRLHVEGLRHVLGALPSQTRRIVYVSTTGVYAQDDGNWVDETSPTKPQREGGIASVAAEQLLTADARGPHSIILRMAGLYGPGRVPRRDELLSGNPIPDPGDSWLNLIHVDDAAGVIVTAADASITGVVNVSDGQPVRRREYLQEIVRLLGAPSPVFEPVSTHGPKSERGSTSKRVGNRRLMTDLRVALRYPSFCEGLAAALQGEEGPPT